MKTEVGMQDSIEKLRKDIRGNSVLDMDSGGEVRYCKECGYMVWHETNPAGFEKFDHSENCEFQSRRIKLGLAKAIKMPADRFSITTGLGRLKFAIANKYEWTAPICADFGVSLTFSPCNRYFIAAFYGPWDSDSNLRAFGNKYREAIAKLSVEVKESWRPFVEAAFAGEFGE